LLSLLFFQHLQVKFFLLKMKKGKKFKSTTLMNLIKLFAVVIYQC
jgi:hypothetical protein